MTLRQIRPYCGAKGPALQQSGAGPGSVVFVDGRPPHPDIFALAGLLSVLASLDAGRGGVHTP